MESIIFEILKEDFFSHSVQHKLDKAIARELKKTNFEDRTTTRLHDKATEASENMIILSSSKRRESILEEGSDMDETRSNVDVAAYRVRNEFLLLKYYLINKKLMQISEMCFSVHRNLQS